MALVIALALMTGLQQELRDRILGANPHVYVWNTSGIADYRAEADKLRQSRTSSARRRRFSVRGSSPRSRETQPIRSRASTPRSSSR